MNPILRRLFMVVLVYPVVFIWLGLRVWKRHILPTKGPAIVIANHNSHLDALVLLSLFPLSFVTQVVPAAAADYFFKNKVMAWFSRQVIGVIPVERGTGQHKDANPLQACADALKENKVLILFPEGTRGEPEKLSEIKSGLWYLCREFADVPVIPVFTYGLGRSMAKGQWLPIPFFVDICIDEPLFFMADKEAFKAELVSRFKILQQQFAHKEL